MIRFPCPSCERMLSCPDSFAGTKIGCSCGVEATAPQPGSPPPTFTQGHARLSLRPEPPDEETEGTLLDWVMGAVVCLTVAAIIVMAIALGRADGLLVLSWAVPGIIVGVTIDRYRGWSGLIGCFVGFLAGPLLALLLLLETPNYAGLGLVKCPYCAEYIKRRAVVCKHCHREQGPSHGHRLPRHG